MAAARPHIGGGAGDRSNANTHAPAWRIDGTELRDSADALYVAYNGWSGAVDFTLRSPGNGKQWYRVTDTSAWAEGTSQVAQPCPCPVVEWIRNDRCCREPTRGTCARGGR
ncbi:hypothetical protein [Streptomyces sp. NPDC057418]|uniref:hypothetical protein n=1 Tax=Streptomyces sp. NPDC057418 TaxID=3346126 RepID=UPI0036937BA6